MLLAASDVPDYPLILWVCPKAGGNCFLLLLLDLLTVVSQGPALHGLVKLIMPLGFRI
jgi:hypothetical protein